MIGKFLGSLVPLARDEHDVAGERKRDGAEDRFATVDDGLVMPPAKAGLDLRNDCFGDFLARVVGGDDGVVGRLLHRRRHERTLGLVAIAAAAEHDDEPTRVQIAQGLHHIRERVVGVGVIHKNAVLTFHRHRFEPSRNAGRVGQRADRRAEIDADGRRPGQRCQRVVDVERSNERQPDEIGFPQRVQLVLRTAHIGPHGAGAEIGAGVHTEGDDGEVGSIFAKPREKLLAPAVVNVHNGGPLLVRLLGKPGEQLHLGLEIGLHGMVKIEVILRQVRENRGVELDIARPALLQGVGGDFHRHGAASGGADLEKQLLQIKRFGRGARRGQNPVADFIPDRADQSRAHLHAFAKVFEQERRRRLAVGAGDPGDFQPERRPPVELRSEIGQRVARVLDHDERGAHLGLFLFGDDCDRPTVDGLFDEFIPILFLAAHRDKYGVFLDPARVVTDAGNFPVGGADRQDGWDF